MVETDLEELPVVYQTRNCRDTPEAINVFNMKRFEGKREDIRYFRDAADNKVYFVVCCGKKNTSRFKVKKGDKIIFNGTDENGFDMGIVGDIGEDDFQIEYLEIVGSDVRKCRNLNRLSPPEDFDNNFYLYYGSRKAKKYKMKIMKKEKREEQKWFLVIHTMTSEEYVEEVVNGCMWEGCEAEHDEAEHDEAEHDDMPELAINYHCMRCLGDTPIARERCRRTEEYSAVSSYEISANDAYNGEGEYANIPTITTWRVSIEGDEYLIDYNNVLFSFDGEILGYAIPSNIQGLEGFNEPFEAVLFIDEFQLPPPKYPNPPKYKE